MVILILSVAVPIEGRSEEIFPVGWRLATEAKTFEIQSDLDGDGVEDRAVLVTNGSSTKAVVFLADQRGLHIIEFATTQHASTDTRIELLAPGKYVTACGKGLVDCDPGDPKELEAKIPVLSFQDGSVTLVLVVSKAGIAKIWLSD